MEIRVYKKEDIPMITSLALKLHDNYVFYLDTYSSCLVLEENGNIIGFISYSIIYDRAEIIDVIIDEKYRDKGYGKKLVSEVITIAFSNNCNNITLEVSILNKVAIRLYENMGFEIVGVRKKYYKDNDGYLMKKDLR